MEQEKKYFLAEDSQLNADDAPFAISPNAWCNAENVRTKSTDKGVTGTVESIGGTLLLSNPQPSLTFITIGGAEDTENARFITCKYCVSGPWHKIICWDERLKQEFDVLLSAQVTDGLNFDRNKLIQSRVVGGMFYWTDDLNRQRKINIDKGIKLNNPSYVTDAEPYTSPLSQEVASLLKRPPLYPLQITKQEEVGLDNNFIKTFSGEFTYAYYYKDGETSVLATYSALANYNASVDDFNSIQIVFPIGEFIDQDVQRIDLIVRSENSNTFTRIFSWDKRNPDQAAEIADHNAGINPLTYTFNNDKGGNILDPAYAIKPFDSVPVKSRTLEVAKDRLFLGNNVLGYDTPMISFDNFTAEFITSEEGANLQAQWWQLQYGSGGGGGSANYYYVLVVTNAGIYNGYYGYLPYPGPTGPYGLAFLPVLVDYPTEMAFIGYTTSDILNYFSLMPAQYINFVITPASAGITNAPDTVSLIGSTVFKSDAPYQIGIVFYDFGDRKCGVVTSDDLIFRTPDREYGSLSFTTSLNWSLTNANALNEIPDWATHYSIVITKCLRTRFFEQARVKNITYVTKDADGAYVFNSSTYAANRNGIGIDVTLLNGYGMGYIFTDGDFVKVYIDSDPNVYTLAITAQNGNWIVCELGDLGALGDTGTPKTTALYELYTPYKPTESEPFYECGQTFPVLFPGTTSRVYSTLSGQLTGDVTILNRGDGTGSYLTENMSPNDKYYKNWITNTGRTNFVSIIGQSIETHTISYSNTYIAGSMVNGLSSFEVLNTKAMPLECGDIWKLQVTSKVQDQQGIVMLCISTNETASLYIGEAQQYGSNQQTNLIVFTDVIGTINVLKGSFGTINPESVVEYRGMVFWYDAINGRIIQYSLNGLFPISDYKMRRYWNLFSIQYLSMTSEEIEALGSRPFVFGGIDPYHNEILFTVPKLLNYPPKGYLPDYPEKIFPFDAWDGQSKTLVYSLSDGEGRSFWRGSFSFTPEFMISLYNKLYSCKYGHNYVHNQTLNYNEFYGIQYSSKIMVVANALPNKPKIYDNIASESNLVPSFVYLYNNQPLQQSSDIVDLDFREIEGGYFSTIKRNKLVPTEAGYTTDGLMTGEKMRNDAMWIMFEWRVTTVPLELRFLNIGYSLSRGYNI